MKNNAELLEEIDRLKSLLQDKDQHIDETAKQLQERDTRIAQLKAEIAWLKHRLFGAGKGEQMDKAQLLLDLGEATGQLEKLLDQPKQKISFERKVPMPREAQSTAEHFKDLPVNETLVIEPEEVKKDPALFEKIGEERTFEVDITAPQMFKREIIRPRYRHRLNRLHPPLVALAPQRIIQGGYASAGLVAWVVTGKYVDHLPLYRLEKMTDRFGARISRKTMTDWIEVASFWLKPVYEQMRKGLIEGPYVQADETPVNFLDPDSKKKQTSKGQLWVMGRPGGPVVFDWCINRAHKAAASLLGNFNGLLQADGYQAYDRLGESNPGIIRLGCMAHVRRKWFDSLRDHPREAELALRIFARIYALEKRYREESLNPQDRGQRRKRELPELFKRIRKVAMICQRKALPKSFLGKAASYTLAQWASLERLIEHGLAELDNNLIENAIRPSAIGKKNWLFIGSPEAGGRTAILYSIIVTCQRYGVEPHAYLKDVLQRLPQMTNQEDLTELLPQNWKQAQ